ncbi:MAG: ATP-binding cassette domain-containing protein [Nitrospinaceae bacterium]|nr:ATP-binding cassette domain-containing protein [Nitrospinaceae bacterium]MBT3435658.1 ATP-binding cassette domain-containing protein [Nitrospinaceae bacterium]MBT4095782.1 ATP-binding cassette domain-containing protein [Nitrospinaceae bacterium]MBT4430483.1 ATP-binding cassette domain-containing protein [Nitrospinaceae bacterium]MBT5366727.1 ATP-binding cassette domain-containing protein [Nitrospinaceae bacterium]
MIEVEGLTKFYGNLPGIQDISFKVKEGEILGFLGPNGAGKSTTMRILTGFLPPTSGTVRVDGFDVTENPLEVQKRLGYLPENNPLYLEMTVLAYLDFVASVKKMRGGDKSAAIERVVAGCGLTNVASRIIGHLSKGYRQRVGLAQALVNDPPVLIMDEPTSGLDPAQIIEIRDLIRELKGNHTIILSTHILPEVNVICDRVVVIHQGRVAAEGSLDALAMDAQEFKVIRVSALGDADALKSGLSAVGGVKAVNIKDTDSGSEVHLEVQADKDEDIRAELAGAVSAAGGRLTELYQERITLEDTFVKIIGGEQRSGEEAAHV